MKQVKIIILAIIFGAVSGALTTFVMMDIRTTGEDGLIRDFYLTENAVHISPHSLRGKMDKSVNDFVLVDLRSQEEYDQEHIIGAVNIPAYKDKNTPAYEEEDRILRRFQELPKDKDIVVYCYSTPCMTGRKIGKFLAENGIYVKHLEVGWNEWRYFWNLWNHEHEWNTTVPGEYVWSGKDPGIPKARDNMASCAVGEFGC